MRADFLKVSFKKINVRLFYINLIMILVFLASQIAVTYFLGTKSQEVETIRIQKDELRLENEILNAEINEAKSIAEIKIIADKKNLEQKNVEIIDMTNSNDLAQSN